MIKPWRTFESNYSQGLQNYKTVAEIARNFAKTRINNYVQRFCETISRLRQQVYDEAYNKKFNQNLGFFQYSACIALSGAVRGLSRKKLRLDIGTGSTTNL